MYRFTTSYASRWRLGLFLTVLLSLPFAGDAQGSLTVIHAFLGRGDGQSPYGALIQASDGNFYGTTASGGTSGGNGMIYKLTPAGVLTTLHSFPSVSGDGSTPLASLIQASDGYLYGTTAGGGANGWGIVFRIGLDGGNYAVLHSFSNNAGLAPDSGLVQASDGNLYGMTRCSYVTQDSHGHLHASGTGTIYRISLTGEFTLLHTFNSNYSEGANPEAALIQASDGNLYGTAPKGGTGNNGVLFRISLSGQFSLFHLFGFGSGEGAGPVGGLIQATDGSLYGTTGGGGSQSQGTVYRITLAGELTILHSFVGYPTEGSGPHATLIQANDGDFYGTTSSGGAGFNGTLFKISPTGLFTQLYAFAADRSDGADPEARLLQASDGSFYGVTTNGSPPDPNFIINYGLVFRFQASSTAVSGTVHLAGLSALAGDQTLTFTWNLKDGSAPFVRQVTVPANGTFQMTGLPQKEYTLHIKGNKWLAANAPVNTVTGNVSGLTVTLSAGDANNDNVVDIGDLLLLIAHYNQSSPDPNYLSAADFNGDGTNDIADLLLLIGNYNQMGDL